MEKKGQIKSIQALRGIAAVMVMIYHKREVFNTATVPFGEFFFGAAAMGVDLFFIISGFIMVLVGDNKTRPYSPVKNAWYFWMNRLTRILPLYYVSILLFYCLVWRGFSFLHDPKSIMAIGKSILFLPLNSEDSAPFYGYAAITVGWTLNYEMFFYALLTISLLFGRYRYFIFFAIISILLLAIPFFSRHFIALDAHHHYHFVFGYLNLMTNPIIWDFVLGMFLGALFLHQKIHWNKNIYRVFFLVFIVWNLFNLLIKWNPGHGVTHWALPLFGLIFTFVFYEKQYGIAIPKWVLFMGKISFSIYLLHPIAQYVTQSFFLHHQLQKWISSPFYLVASVGLTILSATLTQYLIENQFSKILKRWISI